MKRIRLGNDFTVFWEITRQGGPEIFESGMPVNVLAVNMSYPWIKYIPPINIIDNVVSFTFPAKEQQPGTYRVMISYQKNNAFSGTTTYTTDVCNAFEIIPDSCVDIIDEGDINVTADVKVSQDGKDGLNVYQLAVLIDGFQGTIEEYLQYVRQPAIDAADTANEATKDLRILEANISENEEIRDIAESQRNAAEQGRQTAEIERNRLFEENINENSYAAGFAKDQGNYAKTQGDEAQIVIDQAGLDPLLDKATTMRTTHEARSNCNLYNFQAGVTYAVTFVPVFNHDGALFLLDGSSYAEFKNKGVYSNFYILEKNYNRSMAIIPANYINNEGVGGGANYFYTSLKTTENKLNLALLKIWGNSMAISLNGSDWQIKNVPESTGINYPLNHEYGFSPVVIDVSSIGTAPDRQGLINSVREFDFAITDKMKDDLWNNGRPDLVVLDDRLNNNYPVLPFDSIFMNGGGTKTEIAGGWRFTGYVDAMYKFSGYETAPERYVLISFKYRSSHPFKAENYQAGADKIPYTFEASEEFKEVRCLTTLGRKTFNRFEMNHLNVDNIETAFLEVIDFEYKNAVCTGEYLASGFRKNRLIDTSTLKRDIVITGEIDLQYQHLYEDIIYKNTNPTEIPQFVGQRWFNTVSKTWYIANGTSGTVDGVTASGAKATAFRITTDENNVVTDIENIYQNTRAMFSFEENVFVVDELPADYPVGYIFDGVAWKEPEGGEG